MVKEWQGEPGTVLGEALHAMWARLPDLSWLPPSKRLRYIRPRDPKTAAEQALSRYSVCFSSYTAYTYMSCLFHHLTLGVSTAARCSMDQSAAVEMPPLNRARRDPGPLILWSVYVTVG